MNRLIKIGWFLALIILMISWETAFKNNRLTVTLQEDSYLLIHGETNVNRFECNYIDLDQYQKIEVDVNQSATKVYFEDTELSINANSFDCGNRIMNQDLQDLLLSNQYPYIQINLRQVTGIDDDLALIDLEVTIRGDQVNYQTIINHQIEGPNQIYKGELILCLEDFGIKPPKKMFGMIVVDKEIKIEFHLKVRTKLIGP